MQAGEQWTGCMSLIVDFGCRESERDQDSLEQVREEAEKGQLSEG